MDLNTTCKLDENDVKKAFGDYISAKLGRPVSVATITESTPRAAIVVVAVDHSKAKRTRKPKDAAAEAKPADVKA